MDLRHLRYFVMAAEERNISRASARLNISQPAVSRQIRDLEEELGVPLFERESNGLRLTDAGRTALMHAQDILRRSKGMTEAMQAFTRPAKTSLQVGYIPTALPGFLAAGLRTFNHRHEDVCVQIREMAPRQQEKALRKGELDLALLGHACPELRKDFRVVAIRKTPMAAVLPDDHLLALRKTLDLAELADDVFVSLHEKNFPGRPEMMADLAEKAGFTPDVRFKADGLSEILGMVSSGAGVAVLPADVYQLPHPGVVFVKLKRPRIYLESTAVWNAESGTPFIDELVTALKAASG